jgi:hypothetical protein
MTTAPLVIPAHAGIQSHEPQRLMPWTPAFAGVTGEVSATAKE